MVSTAIAGFFVWCAIRFFERGKDSLIEDWVAFIFVAIPAMMIWILSLIGSTLDLSPSIIFFALPLYFLIPTYILKSGLNFKWGRACAYGAVTLVISITVELGFSLISA